MVWLARLQVYGSAKTVKRDQRSMDYHFDVSIRNVIIVNVQVFFHNALYFVTSS